jgi:hypothetical protein
MLRKAMARKTVDYNPSIIRYLEVRIFIHFYLIKKNLSFRILFGREI